LITEGTYTKEEVCTVLGVDESTFSNQIDELGLFVKDTYSFTELMLFHKLNGLNHIVDALLLDPPMSGDS
jgi:hypothetical protein